MKTAKFITFAISLALSFQAVAGTDLSSCPEKPVDKESAVALAGIWFDRGIGLVDAGHDQEALGAFACSMRMVEHPDTVFNAAQAARLADKPELALRLFQRYVSIAPYGSMSRKAERIIRELKQEVPLDDLEKSDFEPVRRPPYPPMELAPFPEEQTRERASLKTAAIAATVTGGAAILAGSVLQVFAYKAVLDGEQADNYPDEWQEHEQRMNALQSAAVATFVVGGVVAGTGLALFMIHKLKKNRSKETAITVLPHHLGVTATVRF